MPFDLEKLFVDVFAPRSGDVVTILVDLPHGEITDHVEWQERREMAQDWRQQIVGFSGRHGMRAYPIVTYKATGSHHADMPECGLREGKSVQLEDIIRDSTIVISMVQFSATAPLVQLATKYEHLRVASMPLVSRSMEETGLCADYREITATCARLVPLFERSEAIEVAFSTGHTCTFDISDHKTIFQDTGLLHPGTRKDGPLFANLPAGEVCTCPNEARDSRTSGEIPAAISDEMIVYVIRNNQIVDIEGDGPIAGQQRKELKQEPALRNIAEVAIGCNDKAVVTDNVLEDEKAGFHWAYGRSDFLHGQVGVEAFSSPDTVRHIDIVYAKGNPIVCTRFDFVFPDGTKKTAIIDGVRCV